MSRVVTAVASTALLIGCTLRYRPAEYPIDTDRIAPFHSAGPVRITTDQPSADEQVVMTNMGRNVVTTYAEVNAVLLAQLDKEIRKRGGIVSPDAPRAIRITVVEMTGRTEFATFSTMLRTRLQVGEEEPRELLVANTSPADGYRALNGAIARTVMQVLADRQVLNHLAASAPAPTAPAVAAP